MRAAPPPPLEAMAIVISRAPLRQQVVYASVCKDWQATAARSMRSHLDFRGGAVPLRAVCLLAATVEWKQISIGVENVGDAPRPAVYHRVVDALNKWSRRRGGAGSSQARLVLDLDDVQVTWTSKWDLEPLMPCVRTINVCSNSLAALRWAVHAEEVVVSHAPMGAAMDAMPPGVTSVEFFACGKRHLTSAHLQRWLAACKAQEYSFAAMALTNAELVAIADAMAPHWRTLAITHNPPRAERGIRAIAHALRTHEGLREFTVSHTAYRTPVLMDIVNSAQRVWHLDISHCAVDPAAVDRIMARLMRYPALGVVTAEGNPGCKELFDKYVLAEGAGGDVMVWA